MGEAKRREELGLPPREMKKDKLSAALMASKKTNSIIVFKGNDTVIACPNGDVFINDGSTVLIPAYSYSYPKKEILLEYCQNKKINFFGVSAKYLDYLKNEKINCDKLDLSALNTIASTGSPLSAQSFEYVYKNIKKNVHLTSISGGTDLVGCLVLGNLYSKVYPSEIQGQSLALDIDIFNDQGESVKVGEKGELVVKKPFPSMPIKFWGDEDGEKYHKA